MKLKLDKEKLTKAEHKKLTDAFQRMDGETADRIAVKNGYVEDSFQIPLCSGKDDVKKGRFDDFLLSFALNGVYVDVIEENGGDLVDKLYKSKYMKKISRFFDKDVSLEARYHEFDERGKKPVRTHSVYRFSPEILKFLVGTELSVPDIMFPMYVDEKDLGTTCMLIVCERYNWSEVFVMDGTFNRPRCFTSEAEKLINRHWTGMSMLLNRNFCLFKSVDDAMKTVMENSKGSRFEVEINKTIKTTTAVSKSRNVKKRVKK